MKRNYEKELFWGEPIELTSGFTIYQPTIEEIKDSVGYDYYEFLGHTLSRYNYEFELDLEAKGLDYKEYNTYILAMSLIAKDTFTKPDGSKKSEAECNKGLIQLGKGLRLMFGNECMLSVDKAKNLIISQKLNDNAVVVYNETIADEIRDVISEVFSFQKPIHEKPVNNAAKIAIRARRAWERKHRAPKYSIYSILTSIFWHPNWHGNRKELFDLTIYQLHEGHYSIDKIEHNRRIHDGIYAGTIDQDKMSPDKLNDINWINKLKTKQ